MLGIIGLVMIVTSWIVQLWEVQNNSCKLLPSFLFLYGFGVILIVSDNIATQHITFAALNTVIFVTVALTWLKVRGYLNNNSD